MVYIRKRFGIIWEAAFLLALALVAGPAGNALVPGGVPLMEVKAESSDGMSVDEVMRLFKDGAVFVDAREEEPFSRARIPGAINIPPGMFMDGIVKRLGGVDPASTLVVYCSTSTCPLADQLAQNLQLMGYGDVRVFGPGFSAWKNANGPVEEG
jgi:rhodanese-related sulfurtransferase